MFFPLCDDEVALKHRLRLFSSCVFASLFCTGSWVLTLSQNTHPGIARQDVTPSGSCSPAFPGKVLHRI